MTTSAAERIVIDDEVLMAQERTLDKAAEAVADAASLASAEVSGAGFGLMCAFIPPAMNAMAKRISNAAQETGTLARRMEEGVKAGRVDFTDLEETAAATFTRLEGMA